MTTIDVNDKRYEVLKSYPITTIKDEMFEGLKKRFGGDCIIKNNDHFFICREIEEPIWEIVNG